MPIDANIALGIRPVEQVNMLGQMGQMMQLRQANDEYESNNALKDFYAQGGDLSRPEDQRRLMSTVGAKGADLIAKQFALQKTKEEVKKLGYDNVESEFKQSRGLLSSIDPDSPNAGAQLMAWHEANHRSPIMGSILAASGIDAASSRATLQASIAKGPAGIREAIRRSSLGQAEYQKELMQTERSHIAAAPGHRNANIAEQRFGLEQKQQAEIDALMRGGAPTLSVAPMTGGGGGGVPNALPAAVGAAPAPTNMLAPGAQTPAAAVPPVVAQAPAAAAPVGDVYAQIQALDAKIAPLVNTGNPRATPIVQQLIAQRNALMQSAKQQYSGDLVDMAMRDPADPTRSIVVKGRRDQYGVLQPVEMGGLPINTNASTESSNSNISPTIARPPPRAGYQYSPTGQEIKMPQVGVPEGVRLKPGERWSEEKQMVEQVPGSAAFIEQQRKHAADLGAIKTVETTTKWGKNRIDTILDPKNKSGFENNFGGFSAYATKEFSGDTARVKSELDSLKSDLKERGLQLFRSGGSIGAMTEKEWPIVESMIASLSPKLEADDARDILRKIKVKFDNIESLAAEKYNDQWQGTQYHKPVDTNRNAPASGGDIDTTNKFLK